MIRIPNPLTALFLAFVASGSLAFGTAPLTGDPVDCVNPLSGTNGDGEFSRGNTVPAIVAPFGMTTWAPQTDGSVDELLTMPSTIVVGSYGHPIHEMRETEYSKMGQYAHVNEPCHHVLYFYDYAGEPWKTQAAVRRVMDELYDANGMVGDEDTGQMSAWYVFNAAGFYPFCPGTPYYLIGSPLFDEVTLHLPEGKSFTVRAKNNGPKHCYIQSARLNGRAYTRSYLEHATLTAGGLLEFEMGDTPNKSWASSVEDAPPNLMH